jgi:hypothetical protein
VKLIVRKRIEVPSKGFRNWLITEIITLHLFWWHFLQSDVFFLTSLELLEASLVARESLSFQYTSQSLEQEEAQLRLLENMADAPELSHCARQAIFDHQRPMCRCVPVQKKPAVLYPFFGYFLLTASLRYLLNCLRSDTSHNTSHTTQLYLSLGGFRSRYMARGTWSRNWTQMRAGCCPSRD